MNPPDWRFLLLLVIFAGFYFGVLLPSFQFLSRRKRGRNFVIRLGNPWRFNDPEHRWDILMSATSFMLALGLSLFLLDFFFPFDKAGQ